MMWDERIYVSTGAFQGREIDDVLRTCIARGIPQIELSSGLAFQPDIVDVIRRHFGRPLRYLLHNYFPPHEIPFVLNLGSDDAETLARSRDHCRVAIDLSAELGAKFFSVHSGFAIRAEPGQLGRPLTTAPMVPHEKAYATFVESLIMLASYAGSLGIMLLVENNVVAPFNLVDGRNAFLLMAEAGELLRLKQDVNSANLGFLVDVGHVNVTAKTLGFDRHAFIDAVAPHVVAFHLSDNGGATDENLPFDDAAWFVPRLRDFPEAAMIVEAYNPGVEQLAACVDAVRSALAGTC